ncbi:META domain-containing protein [Deinococcus sp.]|uniref:META domain-containing protein n=1 Tax=Deinococcus sp. TaxID=47478 RepID=UPI0025BFA95F|nr:META domain-containing protein [Deinococcus sp.]
MPLLASLIVTAVLTGGSAPTMQPPVTLPVKALKSGNWQITALTLRGENIPVPTGSQLTLTTRPGGKVQLTGQAGCNHLSAAGQRSGERLTFSGLAATRMLCDDMTAENALAELFTQPFRVKAGGVVWENALGTVILQYQPVKPVPQRP